MKKKSSNAQTAYLKTCIQESLLNLLRDKPIGQITITDIARNAGASRMTIYRYYDNKEDIIRNQIKDLCESYILTIRQLNLDAVALAPFLFDAFRKNEDLIKLLINRHLFGLISEYFATYAEEFSIVMGKKSKLTKHEHQYSYGYTAAGILSMIKIWVENGMQESNEEMANILMKVKLEQANFK